MLLKKTLSVNGQPSSEQSRSDAAKSNAGSEARWCEPQIPLFRATAQDPAYTSRWALKGRLLEDADRCQEPSLDKIKDEIPKQVRDDSVW